MKHGQAPEPGPASVPTLPLRQRASPAQRPSGDANPPSDPFPTRARCPVRCGLRDHRTVGPPTNHRCLFPYPEAALEHVHMFIDTCARQPRWSPPPTLTALLPGGTA